MNNIKKTDLELFIEHCKNLDFGVTDMRYYSSVALCACDTPVIIPIFSGSLVSIVTGTL